MASSERIAYCAGLLDGEAYIGIKKSRGRYHERIQVRMVDEGAIKFLTETFGGNYYREKPHALRGRPLYCWQASDLLAATILKTVLPYLIVKREVAETVLRLRESKNDPLARRRGSPARRTMAEHIVRLREELYLRCKALNRGEVMPSG